MSYFPLAVFSLKVVLNFILVPQPLEMILMNYQSLNQKFQKPLQSLTSSQSILPQKVGLKLETATRRHFILDLVGMVLIILITILRFMATIIFR